MPDEAFSARSHNHGDPSRDKLRNRGQELEVVAHSLPEPDPWVDVDLSDARRASVLHSSFEVVAYLSDDVAVMRIALHVSRSALPVHRNITSAVIRSHRGQTRRDVVQNCRSR